MRVKHEPALKKKMPVGAAARDWVATTVSASAENGATGPVEEINGRWPWQRAHQNGRRLFAVSAMF